MDRDHVQVALIGAAGVFPGGGRNRGQVRVVLGRVAGQVGRQVGGLGLQELRHARRGGQRARSTGRVYM